MRTFASLEIRFKYDLAEKYQIVELYVAKYVRVTPALDVEFCWIHAIYKRLSPSS